MSSCWFRSKSLSRVHQGSCTPQRCKGKKNQKKITVLKSPLDLQCLPSRKLQLRTLISQNGFRVQDLQMSSQLAQYIYSLSPTPKFQSHKSCLSFHIIFVYSEISALYGHFALLSGFLTSFHLSCCSCTLFFLNHQHANYRLIWCQNKKYPPKLLNVKSFINKLV